MVWEEQNHSSAVFYTEASKDLAKVKSDIRDADMYH